MSDALSGMLPVAIAIAISPIPIVAVILMLLTERSTANAVALLTGWVVALTVIGAGVALLDIGSARAGEDPSTGLVVAQLVLAVILLAAAIRRFRMWLRGGQEELPSRWRGALDAITPPRAAALGFVLIALNPKDGLLTVAAGARLAEAPVEGVSAAIALAVFVVVASSTIAAPIAAELALGERAESILSRGHVWLVRHGNAAVAAVLLVLGIVIGAEALAEL